MICKKCSDEADGKSATAGECGACGRAFERLTTNGLLPFHKTKVVRQSDNGPYISRAKCSGAGRAAMRGHALCKGHGYCDCQHKRKGSLRVAADAATPAE